VLGLSDLALRKKVISRGGLDSPGLWKANEVALSCIRIMEQQKASELEVLSINENRALKKLLSRQTGLPAESLAAYITRALSILSRAGCKDFPREPNPAVPLFQLRSVSW
jgi:hypothetical protein